MKNKNKKKTINKNKTLRPLSYLEAPFPTFI